MVTRLLFLLCTTLWVATAVFAQASDERAGFAIRGTGANREAIASATKQNNPATLGEIYPNPTANQGSFAVNINAPGKIVFYNLLGTPVATQEFSKDTKLVTMDFSNFAEGVYFGIVTSGNKNIGTRRVSIRR
jgi:hypothetical protein